MHKRGYPPCIVRLQLCIRQRESDRAFFESCAPPVKWEKAGTMQANNQRIGLRLVGWPTRSSPSSLLPERSAYFQPRLLVSVDMMCCQEVLCVVHVVPSCSSSSFFLFSLSLLSPIGLVSKCLGCTAGLSQREQYWIVLEAGWDYGTLGL